MDIRLQRKGSALVPFDAMSFEEMDSIREGEWVAAKVTRPRNLQHHRKFFALLTILFEAQDKHATVEGLLDEIKIGIGHCNYHKIKIGRTVIDYAVPRSISFAKMGQEDFDKLYEDSIRYAVRNIITRIAAQDIRDEVLNKLAEA